MILISIYFLGSICSLNIIEAVNPFNKNIAFFHNKDDATVLTESILEYCLENDSIFLTHRKDDISDILKVSSSKSLKIFDINNEVLSNFNRIRKVYTLDEVSVSKRHYPSTGVVINILTDTNLTKLLEDMRNSVWWNSQAVFLLINRDPNELCEAFNQLKILWDYKILSAVYICREVHNEVVLYTFNPFTNSAPKYWQEVQVTKEHWTLFKLHLRHLVNSEFCDILYFDKGKRLNGYRLKADLKEDNNDTIYDEKKSYYGRCVHWSTEIICNVLAKINVTIDVKKSAIYGNIDENGNPQGLLLDIHNDEVDIMLSIHYLRSYWKLMAYPPFFPFNYALCLSTPISFKTKLSFFIEWNFWLIVSLVCTACIFILKSVLQETATLTIIKFVQMTFDSPYVKVPPRFCPRTILLVVIMVTTATNSFMQAYLNWYSALPKYESNIQSDEDLVNLNHTIYGFHYIKDILPRKFIKKFKGIDDFSTCLDMINMGEQVICIADEYTLDFYPWQKNPLIYELKGSLFDRAASYVYAEDFPLSYKINLILQQMREGGLIKFTYNKFLYYNMYTRNIKIKKQTLEYETTKLNNLRLCAYVLLGGWIPAVVVFIVELVSSKIQFKKLNKFFKQIK